MEFKEIDSEESIAAIHLEGQWRFFYDRDFMFLLDYAAYDPEYVPKDGEVRYGTLTVDETNVHQWLASLSGELSAAEVPYARWDENEQVKLTFVIDFDRKFWVGCNWDNDQSALHDYHPQGWVAIEDDVFKYIPDEIAQLWNSQLVKNPIIVSINGKHYTLISPKARGGDWGGIARGIDKSRERSVSISLIQVMLYEQSNRKMLYQETFTELPEIDENWFDVHVSYSLSYSKQAMIHTKFSRSNSFSYLKLIDLGKYQLD